MVIVEFKVDVYLEYSFIPLLTLERKTPYSIPTD